MSDLIDRQSVLNAFDYWVKSPMIGYTNGLVRLREMFEELPPVNPEQKIGHWIMSEDGLCRPICDKCGAHPWKGYIPTTKEATEVFKYCPNCGAKMCGGDNE